MSHILQDIFVPFYQSIPNNVGGMIVYSSDKKKHRGLTMEKLKAIFHVDEAIKWRLTLGNVKNFIQDVGSEAVLVEIVANAAAVQLFALEAQATKENVELLQQMQELSSQKVTIIACRNALKANSIREEVLPAFITLVPAGVTRIIRRQAEGYAYVKP